MTLIQIHSRRAALLAGVVVVAAFVAAGHAEAAGSGMPWEQPL